MKAMELKNRVEEAANYWVKGTSLCYLAVSVAGSRPAASAK